MRQLSANPWRGWVVWAVVVAGMALAGCAPQTPIPGGGPVDGNVGVDPAQHPGLKVQGEPNDTFSQPITVILDSTNHGHLSGSISTASDVDVYVFTTLQVGDRVILDVAAQSSGGKLDADMALFDESGRLMFENDDRSNDPPQFDPYANEVLRRDSRLYYLAMYRSPLDTTLKSGNYEVLITVVPGGQVPAGQSQTVVLNYGGGTITTEGTTTTVGPFNTADIAPAFSGMTDTVKSRIAEVMASGERYCPCREPAEREMLSSIKVPPKSLAPQPSAS